MNARKPQVGWRHPNADRDLLADMFRFGYVKSLPCSTWKSDRALDNFVEDLFNTQEKTMG